MQLCNKINRVHSANVLFDLKLDLVPWVSPYFEQWHTVILSRRITEYAYKICWSPPSMPPVFTCQAYPPTRLLGALNVNAHGKDMLNGKKLCSFPGTHIILSSRLTARRSSASSLASYTPPSLLYETIQQMRKRTILFRKSLHRTMYNSAIVRDILKEMLKSTEEIL